MKQGEQKLIDTPGQQASVHFFGGYNWQTDQVHGIHITPNVTAKGFVAFSTT